MMLVNAKVKKVILAPTPQWWNLLENVGISILKRRAIRLNSTVWPGLTDRIAAGATKLNRLRHVDIERG
jgi:hypothetical protein